MSAESPKNILIVGAGQLGSRYLQGLAKCRIPLNIFVQDINPASLKVAEQRWTEVYSSQKNIVVSFLSALSSLPNLMDIAIVATTANSRVQVVNDILKNVTVQNWILEKILAQSELDLDKLSRAIGSSNAWVNTPRRMLSWHQKIKSTLDINSPLTMTVDGGAWGLACNSVHFLDLLSWLTGETLQHISTSNLRSDWIPAKRPGNFEIFGSIEAEFSSGSKAILTASEGDVFYNLSIQDSGYVWKIQEEKGIAIRSDGLEIPGRIPYQSEMSAELVESILKERYCGLPVLAESISIHKVFIRSLLEHWRKSHQSGDKFLPIT